MWGKGRSRGDSWRPRSLRFKGMTYLCHTGWGRRASVSPPGCSGRGSEGLGDTCNAGCIPPLQTPTLIVYGDQDVELGQTSLNNLQHLPEHQVLMLQGAGHACYLDKPNEWHLGLLDFLQQLK